MSSGDYVDFDNDDDDDDNDDDDDDDDDEKNLMKTHIYTSVKYCWICKNMK